MDISRRAFTTFCATSALPLHGWAQERFPSKPITLVSPASPGGLTDIVVRVFAPYIATEVGQPVVVVNKTGAGGAVGTASVVGSAPDGYTLLLGVGAMATLPEQERLNGRKPPFTVDQLAPVASLTSESLILVTHPDSAFRSFDDVVAFARANPGKLTYSTTGPYGTYHVPLADFSREAGVNMLAVPYGGGGPALLALLRKDVDISFVSRAVGMAQIRAGKLRPLLVWGPDRLSDLPDVPSLKDGGWKTRYMLWTGLFGPAGMPAPVLASLRDAVATVMKNPALQQSLVKSGGEAAPMEGAAFEQFWQAETTRLGAVVQRIGRVE
jgi:tripartite-type tricarboxylate transporter receptor subunit TctC